MNNLIKIINNIIEKKLYYIKRNKYIEINEKKILKYNFKLLEVIHEETIEDLENFNKPKYTSFIKKLFLYLYFKIRNCY